MTDRIAIAGPFASGKTTAADYIMDAYDHHTLVGFAQPLYELERIHREPPATWEDRLESWINRNLIAVGMWAADRSDFGRLAIETFRSIPVTKGKNRALLQELGTEVGRSIDENLWVKLWKMNVHDAESELGGGIINDNLRFPNEYHACQEMGCYVIYLDVSPETQARRYRQMYGKEPTPEELSHSSEQHLPYIRRAADRVINNNSTNDWHLKLALREIVEEGMHRKQVAQ